MAGAKLHLAGSKIRCIEESGKNYTLEEGISDLPPSIALSYQHTQQVNNNNNNNSKSSCMLCYSVLRSVVVWSRS